MPFFTNITWVVQEQLTVANPPDDPTKTPPDGPVNTALYQLYQNTVDNQSRIVTLEAGGGGPGTFTPNRSVKSDGSGTMIVSNVTDTELEYLTGASSNIQAQIDAIDTLVNSGGDAGASHNHDSLYYTQTELSTSGSSSVHWDNITNVPSSALIGGISHQELFNVSGSWAVPADVTAVRLWVVGGGAGAGIDSSSNPIPGDGGGGIICYLDVTPGEVINFTVGGPSISLGNNTVVTISGRTGNITAFGGLNPADNFGGGSGTITLSGVNVAEAIFANGGEGGIYRPSPNDYILYGGQAGIRIGRETAPVAGAMTITGAGGDIYDANGAGELLFQGGPGGVLIEY